MSIGCFECRHIGSFDTLILFDPGSAFDLEKTISSYRNFYTCCASLDDFPVAEKSRFMIVRKKYFEDRLLTGHDGSKISETTFQYVDEAELKRKLPAIFKGLATVTKV